MSNEESIDHENESIHLRRISTSDDQGPPPLPPRQSGQMANSNNNHSNTLAHSVSKTTFIDDQYLEDGPLFRATIKQLESRTSALKANVKRILKAASASLEARRQLTRTDESYIEALRDTQCIEPLMTHYFNNTWQTIREERMRLEQSLTSQLLEPLRQLYDEDIKAAELKRRQFEEESKDYYASLSKYLKNKKKQQLETEEQKQNQRKSKFDLARFDYLGFLLDLHGGKKENEILFHITDHTIRDIDYFEAIANKIEPEKPGLNELVSFITENSREQELTAIERAIKRRELVTVCNINNELANTAADQQLQVDDDHNDDSSIPPTIPTITGALEDTSSIEESLVSNSEIDKFRGIRDLEQNRGGDNIMGRKKEGFLFATSKPSKSTGFDVTSSSITWHK
jgi:hypothetical protein